MRKLFFAAIFLLAGLTGYTKDHSIRSAAELATLTLQPGDRVIMQPGDWSNQQLVFKSKGNKNAPITLMVASPGKLQLTGNSSLVIDGEWLVIDGVTFTKPNSVKGDVITFTKKSNWCRLTNTAIVDYNPTDKRQDSKWISVNGYQNRVDHCYFKGKTNQGTTLVIWVADKPNYHRIDHNFFDARPELGNNGGETIRIGTSQVSMSDSHTTVESNIFYRCNGEMEVVSNKSDFNTISNNLFFECVGTLTLRHGGNATVTGNYFIGNGVAGTGGVRINGPNHKVYGNYLQTLSGTGLKAAISLVNAQTQPELNGYAQVKNAVIYNNTIVNCKQGIEIGAGKSADKPLAPKHISLINNVILGGNPISYTDKPRRLKISNNIIFSIQLAGDLPEGFDMVDPGLKANGFNVYQPEGKSKSGAPAMSAEQRQLFAEQGIGPAWFKSLPAITVR